MAMLPDNPNTRLERYLARLAGQDVTIPDNPINRIECYLAYLIENGGGGGSDFPGVYPNAYSHNTVYRGNQLGASLTDDQASAIDSGQFTDMYVGDYWRINNRVYRIAGFNLFYNVGDTYFRKNHAVIVPDRTMTSAPMHDTASTDGGYVGMTMRTVTLPTVEATIKADFGEGHVLTHRMAFSNHASSGVPSSTTWVDSTVDLMTEGNVFGRGMFGTHESNGLNEATQSVQFPLFLFNPGLIQDQAYQWYWLQDIMNATQCAGVDRMRASRYTTVTNSYGVRPFFCIGKAS